MYDERWIDFQPSNLDDFCYLNLYFFIQKNHVDLRPSALRMGAFFYQKFIFSIKKHSKKLRTATANCH
jgi:hypothetical protein